MSELCLCLQPEIFAEPASHLRMWPRTPVQVPSLRLSMQEIGQHLRTREKKTQGLSSVRDRRSQGVVSRLVCATWRQRKSTAHRASAANKRFFCSNACGSSFTHRGSLTRHLRYECRQNPRFKCPSCDFRSRWTSDVYRHIIDITRLLATRNNEYTRATRPTRIIPVRIARAYSPGNTR
ncbi:PREDICTED: zinc finger protein Helios-like isoform X2 [Eufriesea mexicana]|uniref:zinc finger protein Helios-like isoform X2 n=1 Tax=Eufriesea mexicana TaxID=516756 RepID=UPI00083C7843|nr:PREDICTED: zinc finger protein Helios-like isoform X2 [Eufriesea mexicana]